LAKRTRTKLEKKKSAPLLLGKNSSARASFWIRRATACDSEKKIGDEKRIGLTPGRSANAWRRRQVRATAWIEKTVMERESNWEKEARGARFRKKKNRPRFGGEASGNSSQEILGAGRGKVLGKKEPIKGNSHGMR